MIGTFILHISDFRYSSIMIVDSKKASGVRESACRFCSLQLLWAFLCRSQVLCSASVIFMLRRECVPHFLSSVEGQNKLMGILGRVLHGVTLKNEEI